MEQLGLPLRVPFQNVQHICHVSITIIDSLNNIKKTMNRKKNAFNQDVTNTTYTHKISNLFDDNGTPLTFQQEKYLPILRSISDYFANTKKIADLQLADIGIGYGVFLNLCETFGIKNLFGVDPFPESINIAHKYTCAELKTGTIEDTVWPLKKHSLDVITCFDVIEHLVDPQIFFDKAKNYLAENGVLITRTPNGALPYYLRKIPLLGIKDSNPTHINIHSPRYWRQLAQKTGYTIIAEWKGEHLTHVKVIPKVMNKLCKYLNIDHRKVPLLNMFEQAHIMLLTVNKKIHERS